MYGGEDPPADRTLTRIECLTAGDFRPVRQALCYLRGNMSDAAHIAAIADIADEVLKIRQEFRAYLFHH
jgi:hypothetical protein